MGSLSRRVHGGIAESSDTPMPPRQQSRVHRLTFHTRSEDETIALGATLARVLRPGDVLALDGDLGAGKTRLVRGIAEGLGLDPAQVSSPTYVVIHEYGTATSGRTQTPLFHVDAYRLTGPDDLDSLGWERVMDAFGIVVVEWAERMAAALAEEPSVGHVRIQAVGASGRAITLIAPPAWASRAGWGTVMALAQTDLPEGWSRCPVTGKPVAPDSPTFPFFDEKAKMADLGRWFTGSYVVSRELTEEDTDDPDIQHPPYPPTAPTDS